MDQECVGKIGTIAPDFPGKMTVLEITKCGFWCKLPLFDHFCGAPTQ